MTRWGGAVVVAVLGAVAVLGPSQGVAGSDARPVAGPGAVEPVPIEVSNDGVSWTGALDQPLLDPGVRWVPGNTREVRFHVRHHAPEGGALSVTVRLLPATDRGEPWQDLSLALRVGDGPWRAAAPTRARDEPRRVRVTVPAEPGEPQVVVVRVGVDPAVRGDQGRAADLAVEVALVGRSGEGTGESLEGATSRPVAIHVLLALGALLSAAGTALLLARRQGGRS